MTTIAYTFHKKGSNYYNPAANICFFLYKISSSSTDLSVN